MNNHSERPTSQPLGIAIIGLGGAVATTAVAGIQLIRQGVQATTGLPLAEFDHRDLVAYQDIYFRGWDLFPVDLYTAARKHGVLSREQLDAVADDLAGRRPWPAISNRNYCEGVVGERDSTGSHRELISGIQQQLDEFAREIDGRVVVINLASTEHAVDISPEVYQHTDAFERALDNNDPDISPAMLYAYACITHGVAYGNFTPSRAVDIPALRKLAAARNIPVAGKDGKTGQTYLKTVVAPALRARALHVDGWFSTNILGNRDGEALRQPGSLENKIGTKGDVLGSCLGYPVEDHLVKINYYKPRGDDKEAWDNIDVSGFLGQRMQIKINFLCKDSILAAPLAIEIARCLDLAGRSGQGGVVEALGVFFKAPMTADDRSPNHNFGQQQEELVRWLRETQVLANVAE
ncbi:myo-inositol-1-phosphate synthase [Lewinella aquimaris]|uniref:Myo-inositol-1-phosphate synthase n=1 Tax=Neolewinella aquimaris TaxID=1835722 RepID=A0A840E6V3_9BACT|nr:inositol-3-phosphate synthase [Neolewinella aquimaris]MBB4077818.1 myo-inositol-1-phosphate synthase [Neolewinella aquimaris]